MKWASWCGSEPEPAIGATRVVSKFILWATSLPNESGYQQTRWLERAFVHQEYRKVKRPRKNFTYSIVDMWCDVKWSS